MNFNKEAPTLRISFTWRKGVLAQLCFVLFSLARYLLYNIVLVSAIHQHESATGVHMYIADIPQRYCGFSFRPL